jgi:hypothetical protein
MALQISFNTPGGVAMTGLYLVIDSVSIKNTPGDKSAKIRCVMYKDAQARADKLPPEPYHLYITCKGPNYTTFFKSPPNNPALDVDKILIRAAYQYIKTLDPITNPDQIDFFEGLKIDIKNNSSDLDNN